MLDKCKSRVELINWETLIKSKPTYIILKCFFCSSNNPSESSALGALSQNKLKNVYKSITYSLELFYPKSISLCTPNCTFFLFHNTMKPSHTNSCVNCRLEHTAAARNNERRLSSLACFLRYIYKYKGDSKLLLVGGPRRPFRLNAYTHWVIFWKKT